MRENWTTIGIKKSTRDILRDVLDKSRRETYDLLIHRLLKKSNIYYNITEDIDLKTTSPSTDNAKSDEDPLGKLTNNTSQNMESKNG